MKCATQEEVDSACLSRSADNAKQHLRELGLFASRENCKQTIVRLIETGLRRPMKTGRDRRDPLSAEVATDGLHASVGCQRLLRRHIETGQHWISDPARMASALRQSGMVA